MFVPTGPTEARTRLNFFLMEQEEKTSPFVRERLRELVVLASPVDTCVKAVELIYARAAETGDVLKDIAAGTAAMCDAFGFYALEDNRWSLIARSLRGEAIDNPPAPQADLMPPEGTQE